MRQCLSDLFGVLDKTNVSLDRHQTIVSNCFCVKLHRAKVFCFGVGGGYCIRRHIKESRIIHYFVCVKEEPSGGFRQGKQVGQVAGEKSASLCGIRLQDTGKGCKIHLA